MRQFIFLILCLIFIICVLFYKPIIAAEINPAQIRFDILAPTDTPIERSLTIVNNETQDIFLDKVRSSCDCLVIKKDVALSPAIPAGKHRVITFTLYPNLIGKGKFAKYIFLSFKNSASPVISLKITGEIR